MREDYLVRLVYKKIDSKIYKIITDIDYNFIMTSETIAAYCFVFSMLLPALYQLSLVLLNTIVTYVHKKITHLGR